MKSSKMLSSHHAKTTASTPRAGYRQTLLGFAAPASALSLTPLEWTAHSPVSCLFTLASNQEGTQAQVQVAVNEDRIGKVWGHHGHRKATHSALLSNLGRLRLKPFIVLRDMTTTNLKAIGACIVPPVTSETGQSTVALSS